MKTYSIFTALCATAILSATPAVNAAPLPVINDYNTLIFNDATFSSSDTQGRLAIGGNALISNYSVGDQLSPTEIASNDKVLVVGGELNFQSGRVFHGDAYITAPAVQNTIPQTATIDGTLHQGITSPIDFSAAKTTLTDYSNQLASISTTGSFVNNFGGLTFTGDNTDSLQIFNIDNPTLDSAWGIDFSNINSNATILINVTGSNAGMTDMNMESIISHRERVLFNFSEATNLNLSGIAVHGSILAPNATMQGGSGVIWGQLVLDSMNATFQQNHILFDGDLPSVPEPASAILLMTGAVLLHSRQRKQRI
ncbi:choice-of-anchor A family protein [Planctomycetota bacterium]|nr:choice-of-anchor A family protein [Planctomycetota bacterium]